ncbi:hypothetical protein HYS94_01085 [Candidatus Daviesbacteria bacterium]|nr:hypothetical protein [Candidatus Daviesbacteria bacterium]
MGKKETIGKLILYTLEKAIDGYVRYDDLIYHPYSYAGGNRWDKPLKKDSLAQALKRLREKKWVEKVDDKKTGEITYKLTNLGREFLLILKTEDQIEWDGKWRIIVFDIPEKRRSIRDILRSRLKLWGFKPWQQSVWASKKNLTNKLRALIKELGIEDWVLVIESDNVGR